MVWAGISAQGKTDLHIIDNGTLTALRYVNEILDFYVRPYAGAVGENFILMDDNARAHRARITDQYLEQARIVRMEWPARFPYLNPIEHAWDMLQTAVSSVHKTSKFLEILDFFIFMIAPKMLIFYHYVLRVSLTLKITPEHSIFNKISIPKTLKF